MLPSSLEAATILVPVDFDEASVRAVATAVGYARAFHGRLVILHVVPPTSFPEGTRLLPLEGSDPVDLEEYVSARALALLDARFAFALRSGAEARIEVRSGHPVETILRAIGECDAKLVIVGTHGRSGAARLVLGSVAEEVLRSASVPVMTIRADEVFAPEHPATFTAAAALSGVVAGAATGALAGPAGAVAGGAIGGILGAIAGNVMTHEDIRSDAHGRELDDAIGVTRGSLGTPPGTKEAGREVVIRNTRGASRV